MKYRSQTLEEIRDDVVSLTRPILAELRSYSAPPATVHKTIIATYMLLGEPAKKLRDWSKVLSLLKESPSLMTRIRNFDDASKNLNTVKQVRVLIKGLTYREVCASGTTVISLFGWVKKVCEG